MSSDDPTLRPEPATPAAPKAARPARRLRHAVYALLAVLLLGLAGLVGGVLWAVGSEAGTRALLSWVPGLRVAEASGALLGNFAAERVELALPHGGALLITKLRWQGLRFEREAAAPWSVRLAITRLEADRAELRWVAGPPSTTRTPPPAHMRLPLGVEIGALRLGEFRLAGNSSMAPVRDISAAINLAAGEGTHRISGLALAWDRLRLAGDASLGAAAPMPLTARLDLRSVVAPPAAAGSSAAATALPPWGASLQAQGPLQRFALQAALRAQDQSLDAKAEVTPFEPLPVSRVDLGTRDFNLAALWSAAPRTAITGQLLARLDAVAGAGQNTQPLHAEASFDNNAAGRWDQGRLPVRRLQLEARSDVRKPQQGELRIETLELGSATQAAGRLRGSGRWDGQLWSFTSNLEDIAPAGLDARAPALLFGGPIAVDGSGGLPWSAPAPAGPAAAASAPLAVDVRGALNGRLLAKAGSPALAGPLAVQIDAGYKPGQVSVRKLEASAAGAQAHFKGEGERNAGAAGRSASWHLLGEGSIENFDPRPWWPAATQAAARAASAPAAPSKAKAALDRVGTAPRINADASFDLHVPERAPGSALARSTAAWLAAWRGQAKGNLRDSQLAGVPLTGALSLATETSGQRLLTEAQIEAGGNRIALKGALDAAPSTQGSGDRWTFDAQAPTLATLAPLLRLALPAADIGGSLEGQVQLSGRWPALTTQGNLKTEGFAGFGLTVPAAQARWALGTSPDAETSLQAEARQLALGTQKIELLQVQLQGTGRAHRASLRAELPPVRPAGVNGAGNEPQGAIGNMVAQRLLALAQAEGGWSLDTSTGTLGWRGRVQRLELLPNSSAPATTQAAATQTTTTQTASTQQPWLRAEPFDIDWSNGQAGQRLNLSPTRLAVLNATLRLRQFEWAHQPQQPTHLRLQAELEPLMLAPLLARLQPDFGWAGDLGVAGRIELRSSAEAGFFADALIERTGGDLSVVELAQHDSSVQRLGLTEARFGFSARDGVWRFSQQVAGSNLGRLSGTQTVNTRREAVWPEADSPIDGTLDLRVDNLGTWGSWVPAGWRLSGQLATQARVSGRFGAQEFTGHLSGRRIGVRNVLAGVNLSDGELDLALQGETATLERFSVRGGEGTVKLEGGAVFGAKPRAQLKLVADRFAVLSRVDRRIVASGEAQLQLDQDAIRLEGRLTADEGLIDISRGDAPSLSDDVVVTQRGAAPTEASAEPPPSRLRKTSLNLRADLGQNFRLRGRGIDTLLRGGLTLTSPNGALTVNGTIRTEEGTYNAYAQKLTIERGIIAFSGPVDTPRMDILALRTPSATALENDVKVGVSITGTPQNPRVRLYSEPVMSDADKLSWLVLGRGPDSVGRNEAAVLQQAAMALLAGEDEGPGANFLQAIGLDELSLHQEDDGNVRETVVTVGKQLSKRWYVGYERSLSAVQGNWQIIYRAAQRFTLRAQSGDDNALDAIWTWRWN